MYFFFFPFNFLISILCQAKSHNMDVLILNHYYYYYYYSELIIPNTGILTLSFQTLEF